MAEAVLRVLNDAGFRNVLVQKGFQRAGMYNWDDAAYRILDIYEEDPSA